MANVTKLPQISEANYEAVRNVLKHGVPASYREWLDLCAKWVAQYPNHTFVDVDPEKLAIFLGSGGHGHDLKTLLDFIWKDT